jgi:hypothetical protein
MKKTLCIKFKLFMITNALIITTLISPTNSYAYEYWGPWYNHFEFSTGISSDVYSNNAPSTYSYNGTIYNFGTAFNGAFDEWYNLTESNIRNNLYYSGIVKIRTEGQNYGNLNLHGWVE